MVCATRSRSPVEHLARHQEAKSGRQIVEHDHRLAGIDQLMHHVAADIAGPARDQDRHDQVPSNLRRILQNVPESPLSL
jgi:hypothetical protein